MICGNSGEYICLHHLTKKISLHKTGEYDANFTTVGEDEVID